MPPQKYLLELTTFSYLMTFPYLYGTGIENIFKRCVTRPHFGQDTMARTSSDPVIGSLPLPHEHASDN